MTYADEMADERHTFLWEEWQDTRDGHMPECPAYTALYGVCVCNEY